MFAKRAARSCLAMLSMLGFSAVFVGLPSAVRASVVFNDTMAQPGSTLDTSNVTPSGNTTGYQIASSKNATNSNLSAGDLKMELNSSTGSGFVEIQALFSTDPTPYSLVNVGDTVEYDVTFKNTNGGLLAGGTSSNIMMGLFNSGGSAPYASGALANSGLSTTTGSTYATGGTQLWVGYSGIFFPSGANSQQFFRPAQNGAGTTSANQELMGNNFGGGAFDNPNQATKTNTASTLSLTSNSVYTADMLITLLSATEVSVTTTMYSGTSPIPANSLGGTATTDYSGSSLVTSFDGLGFGARNSGNSFNPVADISDISVTYTPAPPVPEPATFGILAVAGIGLLKRRHRAA